MDSQNFGMKRPISRSHLLAISQVEEGVAQSAHATIIVPTLFMALPFAIKTAATAAPCVVAAATTTSTLIAAVMHRIPVPHCEQQAASQPRSITSPQRLFGD